jgi:hypothetical protein
MPGRKRLGIFQLLSQYLCGGAKNVALGYVLRNTFSVVSTEKKYLCAILLHR